MWVFYSGDSIGVLMLGLVSSACLHHPLSRNLSGFIFHCAYSFSEEYGGASQILTEQPLSLEPSLFRPALPSAGSKGTAAVCRMYFLFG